jgi:TPP-dependent pyruvate/acetoin dehydrogenase alpha subunit
MTTPPARVPRLRLLRDMLKVRRVEERIQALYPKGDMRCPTHFSIGQEAVAAGVCAALRREDYVISAHRSHAHYINKGGNLRTMFAELYGKSDGCAGGRGGSMHLIDLSVNFLGCVPLVGSTIPIGVGAAFGARLRGETDTVTVVFFGDGATETGVFHESLNFAATHKLPVLFLCENNLYSVNTPLAARQPANRSIVDLARGHGIRAEQGDGQLVESVHAAATDALDGLRRGTGPVLLEFMTYRWLEHCGPLDDLHLKFRPDGEYEQWTARCPIRLQRAALEYVGLLDEAGYAKLCAEIDAEIDDAIAFAEASPFSRRDQLLSDVYATGAR